MLIRKIQKSDLNGLKKVIESTNLFPADLLEEMSSSYFEDDQSSEIWLTMELEGSHIALLYCVPERMTSGTFNLLLIAIHSNYQGKGFGGELIRGDYVLRTLTISTIFTT